VMHGFDGNASFKINNKAAAFNNDFVSYLTPVSKFDPQGNSHNVEGDRVKSTFVKNDNTQFSITY